MLCCTSAAVPPHIPAEYILEIQFRGTHSMHTLTTQTNTYTYHALNLKQRSYTAHHFRKLAFPTFAFIHHHISWSIKKMIQNQTSSFIDICHRPFPHRLKGRSLLESCPEPVNCWASCLQSYTKECRDSQSQTHHSLVNKMF